MSTTKARILLEKKSCFVACDKIVNAWRSTWPDSWKIMPLICLTRRQSWLSTKGWRRMVVFCSHWMAKYWKVSTQLGASPELPSFEAFKSIWCPTFALYKRTTHSLTGRDTRPTRSILECRKGGWRTGMLMTCWGNRVAQCDCVWWSPQYCMKWYLWAVLSKSSLGG